MKKGKKNAKIQCRNLTASPVLLIRLDDITPDMNWERWNRAKQIFDHYEIKPLIGVVPDNQDSILSVSKKRPDFWEYIQKLQREGYTIAQHGYCHIYDSEDRGLLGIRALSEFAGLPYERQQERINKGKQILQEHGIKTGIFMAPGHTYDEVTLQVLNENRFRYVTDGYSDVPYQYQGLCFMPCTISKPKVPRGYDTLCLHVNGMQESDFAELDVFIRSHRELIHSYSEFLSTEHYEQRNRRIANNEKRNLKKRSFHKAIAEDEKISRYMERTDSANKYMKLMKRIVLLPTVVVRLLRCWMQ